MNKTGLNSERVRHIGSVLCREILAHVKTLDFTGILALLFILIMFIGVVTASKNTFHCAEYSKKSIVNIFGPGESIYISVT